MLSRVQEARVLEVLGDCPSGAIRTYCLEHLAAAVKIPPAHAAHLIAFIQAQFGRLGGMGEEAYLSYARSSRR